MKNSLARRSLETTCAMDANLSHIFRSFDQQQCIRIIQIMTKKKHTIRKRAGYQKISGQVGQYDKIWRENLKAALPGVIEKVLGIKILSSEVLSYRLPIRQYVIYLGEKPSTMPASIDLPGLKFEYKLISIRDVPYQLFLSSRHPEEKILSVLGDFGGEDPEQVLEKVVLEVRDASKGDFVRNQRIQQLRIFIQLRNLAKEFNKVMETVAKFFKEENDPFFIKGEEIGVQKGIKEGVQRGMKEGVQRGMREGTLKGKTEVVQNLLLSGRFTIAEIAGFANVEERFVKKIKAAIT